MIKCQFDREDTCVWHKPVRGLVANRSAERAGNSDRPSLVAPDSHVALAGDDERRAAAGGASGRSLRIVRIEHGASVGGVATAREAKMLAHGLADDLSTGIEVQRYCRPFRRLSIASAKIVLGLTERRQSAALASGHEKSCLKVAAICSSAQST